MGWPSHGQRRPGPRLTRNSFSFIRAKRGANSGPLLFVTNLQVLMTQTAHSWQRFYVGPGYIIFNRNDLRHKLISPVPGV